MFFVSISKAADENIRIQIRIRNPVYGSKDQDPSQYVKDSVHCPAGCFLCFALEHNLKTVLQQS